MTFGLYFLSSELSNELFTVYYWIIFWFLVNDLALTFFKGYYNSRKGIIIDDMRKIAVKYLKFQFWIDFLNIGFLIIPYTTQAESGEAALFIPLFLTWIKKGKIQRELIYSIQYYKKVRTIMKLTFLSLDFLLIGHYGACAFLKIDFLLEAADVY
jgi:hypothetical protein